VEAVPEVRHFKPAKVRNRWRFKPRSVGPFIIWGITLFLVFKIVLLPLTEGVFNYFSKTVEVNDLKTQYQNMKKELGSMKKVFNHMKTSAYVEERGHQIGLIKPNESQMVVIDPPGEGAESETGKPPKKIEIGD
jgi:hypothetical protein